jgi:hypothetical protein
MAGSTLIDEAQKQLSERQEQYGAERRNMNTVRDKIFAGQATQSDKDWMVREIAKQAKDPNSGVHFSDALRKAIQDSPTAPEPKAGKKPYTDYGPPAPVVDEDVKAQHDQWTKEEQDAVMGLHRAQGAIMTIGDRRALIGQDLKTVQDQIAATQAKLASKTLGLSAASFGKMTDIEKDDLKHKLTMEMYGEQSKAKSLQGDLKDKPLGFSADSMSKVGLYGASAVAFNPVLGAAQKTNQLLEKIVINTTRPAGQSPKQQDPYAP